MLILPYYSYSICLCAEAQSEFIWVTNCWLCCHWCLEFSTTLESFAHQVYLFLGIPGMQESHLSQASMFTPSKTLLCCWVSPGGASMYISAKPFVGHQKELILSKLICDCLKTLYCSHALLFLSTYLQYRMIKSLHERFICTQHIS